MSQKLYTAAEARRIDIERGGFMSDQNICKGSAFYWQLVDFLKEAGANDPEHAAWWIVEEFQLSKLTDEELNMAVTEGEIMVNK